MFRFTIRELVLVTVIAALGVSWWLDRREVERRSDARIAEVQRRASDDRNHLLAAIERVRIILERMSSDEAKSEGEERILATIKAYMPKYSECPLPDSN